MAKREPLGKDPLEWIKRTKPADDDAQPQAEAQPGAGAPQPAPPPAPAPATPPTQGQTSWLDSIAAAERQTPPAQQPAEQPPPPAPELNATEAVIAPPPADLPAVSVAPETAPPAESTALPSAVAQPDEEEPTEILGVGGEEEEVTAEKLRAEKHYVHVGSTDDEVSTLPKLDTDEYAATGFPVQERSLLFPIIMIVCIVLMGLIVAMWAETRLREVEQRLTRMEKKMEETRGAQD
ncbi:MAG: hypothetical protein AB1696_14730 [Planctomycetota bacterium]